MEWASWSEFWNMGGYGLYVWGSYGATLILVAAEIFLVRRGRTGTINRLKRMRKWEEQ